MPMGVDLRNQMARFAAGLSTTACTGPYTLRFGTSCDETGPTGEPPDGVNGYSRPSIALVNLVVTNNVVTINQAITFAGFTGNLGTMNAVSLHAADGRVIAYELLSGAWVFTGTPAAIPAGGITLTLI